MADTASKLTVSELDFDTIKTNLNNINGRPMNSGMVFIRVESGNEQLVKKFIILKK